MTTEFDPDYFAGKSLPTWPTIDRYIVKMGELDPYYERTGTMVDHENVIWSSPVETYLLVELDHREKFKHLTPLHVGTHCFGSMDYLGGGVYEADGVYIYIMEAV